MGYHQNIIIKGKLGEFSKIEEEFYEFKDAYEQGVKILQLVELSDLIGAIELYINKYHENFSLDDLIKMKNLTKSAFTEGHRK